MYISRSILLIGLILLVFTPLFREWLAVNDDIWVKPYIIWLLIILIVMLVNWYNETRDS